MDIYLIDSQSIYTKTVAIDPMEALPGRCVLQSPPALTGDEVASWNGAEWSVLSARPVVPKPAPDLEALRAAKNDEINTERERRTFDAFTHAGKTISCDTLSRSDIDGINGCVALNGEFPAIWPGAWKCADNSYLPIATIDEWKSFYGSMVAAGSALYARAQELKAALAEATTAEEIAAVVW